MRVVIDTNVLISATTDRAPDQAAQIRELFHAAATDVVELLIPECSLFEFVYVLRSVYALSDQRIRTLLGDLLALPNLEVLSDFDPDRWLRLWAESIQDPNDAAIAAAALATRSAVATFDRRFARRLTLLSVGLWQWNAS